MKKITQLLTLALFLLLVSCTQTEEVETITSKPIAEETVNQFMNEWHQAASDANFDGYFNAIAEEGIFVGTDEEEVWSKKEFIEFSKPYFDKGKAWDFKTINRQVYQNEGNYVWFNETLDTWMGVCRGSGILKKNVETGQLEIKQYVLSITIPNESIEAVNEAVKKTESLEE